jgi:hypothetical protein
MHDAFPSSPFLPGAAGTGADPPESPINGRQAIAAPGCRGILIILLRFTLQIIDSARV